MVTAKPGRSLRRFQFDAVPPIRMLLEQKA